MPQLPARLQRLVDCLLRDAAMADIATDHALVPIAAVQGGLVPRAIGVDIRAAPLRQAAHKIVEARLESEIDLRLGDGLQPLRDHEVRSVVIAGVGGSLCIDILRAGIPKGVERLVLQTNTEQPRLRAALPMLGETGWALCDEHIDYCQGRFFITLVARPGAEAALSTLDLDFGPYLRRRRSESYLAWLDHKIGYASRVVDRLNPQNQDRPARRIRERLAYLRRERASLAD